MIYVVAGIALVVIGGLILEISHLRRTFDSVYDAAIAERDTAREESKTLRAALFPQLAKLGAEQAPKRAQAAAPLSSSQPPAFSNSRIPWRIRFKQLGAQHNTKQIGRDRTAAAISTPQPAAKEASHG